MKKSITIYMIKQHVNSYESSLEEIPNSLEFLEEKYNTTSMKYSMEAIKNLNKLHSMFSVFPATKFPHEHKM